MTTGHVGIEDFREAIREQYSEILKRDIPIIMHVFSNETHNLNDCDGKVSDVPCMYTFGNFRFNIPELIMTLELDKPNFIYEVLIKATEYIKENGFKNIDHFNFVGPDYFGSLRVKFRPIINKEIIKYQTKQTYDVVGNKDYMLTQILIPDENGTYPDEPGYVSEIKQYIL